jgi:Glycoside-hydrolase family GH114
MNPRIRHAVLVLVAAAVSLAPAPQAIAHAAAHRNVVLPPANGRFDYQLSGDYKPLASVRIVDRDSTAQPARGFYNICYLNAFQTQAYQDKWWKAHHPGLLLHTRSGKLVEDPGWPGEIILNISSAAKRKQLAVVEDGWLKSCATKGFDAVEADNLDSYTRSRGLLTQADDFAFAKVLIADAHAAGLAIAQKNDAEQSARGKKMGFDFAIAEECEVYSECSYYLKAYGNQVYEIEYTDNPRRFYTNACKSHGAKISIILRDRDVVPRGNKAYRYQAC